MKLKPILIFILLIFSISFASAVHCWFVDDPGTTVANLNWSNTVDLGSGTIIQNNISADKAILINGTLAVSGFSNYKFHCNNGNNEWYRAYGVLKIDDNFFCNNVPNCSTPGDLRGYPYCAGSRSNPRDSPDLIGLGSSAGIAAIKTFGINDIGMHKYEVFKDNRAVYGQIELQDPESLESGYVFVVSYPSLLAFGPEDSKQGFYENNGAYERDVVFTLRSEHVLDINLMDYEINCPGTGITCSIEDTRKGFIFDSNNKTMLLYGKVIIDKSTIPRNDVVIDLNAHYQIVALKTMPPYDAGSFTSTKPTKIEVGFLDKQTFQVQIKANDELFNCVGADGTIGYSGPDYSPRVNLTYGGNDPTVTSRTVDVDECNSDTNDWVYCSQSEFIISLAQKIAAITEKKGELESYLQNTTMDPATRTANIQRILLEISELENFKLAIRDTNLSASSLNNSINYVNTQLNGFITNSGLESFSGSSSFGGSDKNIQIIRLRDLFTGNNKVTFSAYNSELIDAKLETGDYTVNVNIVSDSNGFNLFNSNNSLNQNLEINIDFTPGALPNFDWFFYEQGIEEIFRENMDRAPSLAEANVKSRGIIFEFEHIDGNNDLTGTEILQSFATPVFIKIEKDGNIISNKFNIETDGGLGSFNDEETFTFWSGFATNKGEGCEDISKTQENGYLVLNTPDYINPNQGDSSTLAVEIEKYNIIDANDIEYLQSIIYLPYDDQDQASSTLTINGDVKIYTDYSSCITFPCVLELKAENTSYKVNNLQETFDGITNGRICVSEERFANKTNWKLFWNELEILSELNSQKNDIINDATQCEARIITNSTSTSIIQPVFVPPQVEVASNPIDDAVAYWSFDTSDGSSNQIVKDIIGNADGNNVGATQANGKKSEAYFFDGDNDRIEIGPRPELWQTGENTISLWTYPEGIRRSHLFSTESNDEGTYSIIIENTAGILKFFAEDDLIETTQIIPDNTWTHITISFDGTNAKIYINGDYKETLDYSAGFDSISWEPNNPIFFGARHDGTEQEFEGYIDEVGVWNKVLTSQEITTLYTNVN
jgi:hypothetical protein